MKDALSFALALGAVLSAEQAQTPPPKPRTLTEPQIREIVGRVRAGRNLTPRSRPYDSSLMADDRPYEVLAAGQPTGIIELPVEWILDDFPYFWMDRASTVRPTMTPDEVYSIWKAEFDGAYQEGTTFILTMHPHVSGHRARIAMLDRLVTYMKSRPGVWFATHDAIARYVREQAGLGGND